MLCLTSPQSLPAVVQERATRSIVFTKDRKALQMGQERCLQGSQTTSYDSIRMPWPGYTAASSVPSMATSSRSTPISREHPLSRNKDLQHPP